MSATIGNPCDIATGSVKNTGVECSASLDVAKGLFLVAPSLTWTSTDELDPVTWFKTQIHARKIFPILQGIFEFAANNESDVSETNPISGTTRKLRPGGITMTYTFQDGGMCLQQALKTFEGKGYRVIMADQKGQLLRRKNADGTFSGLKSNDIGAAFIFASATVTYKNTISISLSQEEISKYGDLIKIVDGDVTDFNGLVDVDLVQAATPTNTTITIGVRTECAHTDLVARYNTTLADLTLYTIKDKATGVVVTPTAVAIFNGAVRFTGTFASTHTYVITGTAPSVYLGKNIEFFDASSGTVEITIP